MPPPIGSRWHGTRAVMRSAAGTGTARGACDWCRPAQPASQDPGSSSVLVRAIWKSCISQAQSFTVRVLRSLSPKYFCQKRSIFIHLLVCMALPEAGEPQPSNNLTKSDTAGEVLRALVRCLGVEKVWCIDV